MVSTALLLLLLGYLPGALLFRLPVADVERRTAVSAEERGFWGVVLSLAVTSIVGLVLAAAGAYRLDRLALLNVALCAVLGLAGGRRLRLPPGAPRLGPGALVPAGLLLLALALFFHVPPAEYVVGGRDPGVYVNEGIQIAQRGAIRVEEPLVASMPPDLRPLFFRERSATIVDRFLAFFVVDFERGRVVGQFPHLYPLWIGIAYDLGGLTGARQAVGWLAVLGVLAVYFCGQWLVGRPAAVIGAGLLTLNVAQVWYSRYPNSEVLVQALVFAGLLAYSRLSLEDDRFFGPVAATLVTLSLFAHLSSVLIVAGFGVAVGVGLVDRRDLRWSFMLPLALGLALAAWYFAATLDAYLMRPRLILSQATRVHVLAAGGGLLALAAVVAVVRFDRVRRPLRAGLPAVTAIAVLGLAGYAYLVRAPVGRLAVHDAYALRDFATVYLSPLGLLAALVGLLVMTRRAFWRNLAFLMVVVAFSGFVFYKIRIIPEHYWLARRYLPVILPAACLLIGAALWAPATIRLAGGLDRRLVRGGLLAPSAIVLVVLVVTFAARTRPIVNHVEYAGVIPQLESLDARIGSDDLVVVEARTRSDLHVLAVPLAYIYGEQVLVLAAATPDPSAFAQFLGWARDRYRRVLFVAGGGSRVISGATAAVHLETTRFRVPEYARTYPDPPRETRLKQFDVGLYELVPRPASAEPFDLDVGSDDAIHVFRFHAAEAPGEGRPTFRWTRAASTVLVPGVRPETEAVTVWLDAGGRPATVPPALVTLTLGGRVLGTLEVTSGFRPYTLPVPPDHAAELAAGGDVVELIISSNTWTPAARLGSADTRSLGVMVDRVVVE